MNNAQEDFVYVRYNYSIVLPYSRDDRQEKENASTAHQRELLKEYAKNNGYTNLRCYADDGYSGTNFNRPDYQRMLC